MQVRTGVDPNLIQTDLGYAKNFKIKDKNFKGTPITDVN